MVRSGVLSAGEARRVAVAALGLHARRPAGAVDRRHVRAVLRSVALLQIDSVNIVARAHYLPLFSRLGAYPTGLLDRMAYRDRELFEYWGHEASLLPVAVHPLLRWRMARAARSDAWGIARERPGYVEAVLAEVGARGPVAAADLEPPRTSPRRGTWWDRSDAKRALEILFWTGEVAVATRTAGFERRYDVPERVLPAAVLAAPTPTEDEAHRALLERAARSHGVGTARDLADYFRLPLTASRARLAELVEAGALLAVAVEGWAEPAYLHPAVAVPRRVDACALLAPFDPLVWERARAERLFGFRYRIEIYVPAAQRRYGYYVLPFLLGDRLVARVDLKADRAAGQLRVLGAWAEPTADPAPTAAALAGELAALARWLELADVTVAARGDFAPLLARVVAS